jgi:cellulose synthase/poly-beta-1,6-N-acetylglucosamine synthase-like glycosyltransferase
VTLIIEIAFWLSALALFHVYVGYPLIMLVLSRRVGSHGVPDGVLPSVSLIVSAHNEERVIVAKLKNAIALDYPKDLLEIMVVSDCSDDGTDKLVHQFSSSGVILIRQSRRLGKSAGLNLGVPQTSGEVLVFSDANAFYRPDAIRQLARHFSNPRVGYVVGNSRYDESSETPPSAQSESLYWTFETWLKKCESRFHSVVGGDGAIYAIRRELFSLLQPTDINDFINPLQIVNRGYVGIFEPDAISYERAAATFRQEFRRKTRIVSRSLQAVTRVAGVLNPFRNPRHWFALVSHKVLRWFAPCFMTLLLVASLALWNSPFYRFAVLSQGVFYLLAAVGSLLSLTPAQWRLFYVPYYFCLVNAAALVGIFQCMAGNLSSTWTHVRLDSPNDHSTSAINIHR